MHTLYQPMQPGSLATPCSGSRRADLSCKSRRARFGQFELPPRLTLAGTTCLRAVRASCQRT